MSYTVKLEYFRPESGKYYTDGEYETDLSDLTEIWYEVIDKKRNEELPGINGNEWIIYVRVPDHPCDHPKIIPLEVTDRKKYIPIDKRDCSNCRYQFVAISEMPCFICMNQSRWELDKED